MRFAAANLARFILFLSSTAVVSTASFSFVPVSTTTVKPCGDILLRDTYSPTRTNIWSPSPAFLTTRLYMVKSRARNKQAELLEKMAAAKIAKNDVGEDPLKKPSILEKSKVAATTTTTAVEEERAMFAKLLNATRRAIPQRDNDEDDFGDRAFFPEIKAGKAKQVVSPRPKTPQSTNTTTSAADLQADTNNQTRAVIAERVHFESLLNVTTEQPLGAMTAARMVPWVPPYLVDSLVVLTDPRRQSRDLRVALQYLQQQPEPTENNRKSSSPNQRAVEKDMNQNNDKTATAAKKFNPKAPKRRVRVIGITADAPQQARGWMKSSGLLFSNIQVLSDPDLQWLMAYNVIGGGADDCVLEDAALEQQQQNISNEWSLTLIEFDTDGSIRRFLRNVDPTHVPSLVEDETH